MDSFDKKLTELYKKEQVSNQLPEGFDWEDMSEGIYHKMEEPNRKKRPFFVWLFFSGSVLILSMIGFLYFFSPANLDLNKETTNTSKPNKIANATTSTAEPIITPTPITEYTSNIATHTQRQTQDGIQQNKVAISTPADENLKIFPLSSISDDLTISNNKNKLLYTKNKTSLRQLEQTNPFTTTKNEVLNLASGTSIKQQVNTLLIPSTLPIKQVIVPNPVYIQSIPQPALDENDSDPTSKITLQVVPYLYGGTLLTTGKYKQHTERNKHSRWSPGYYAGIDLSVLKYKKWTLNVGYEHKFAVQILELDNVIDTVPIQVENVLTSVTTNSLNGTRTENRATVNSNGIRTRNYLHYNTFRSHAITLGLARHFNLAPQWQLYTRFGGTYNFLHQPEGRTLDEQGNKLDYDKNNPIYLAHYFSVNTGISLQFKVKKLALSGNFGLEKPLTFSHKGENSINPTFYKVGVGVKYFLD